MRSGQHGGHGIPTFGMQSGVDMAACLARKPRLPRFQLLARHAVMSVALVSFSLWTILLRARVQDESSPSSSQVRAGTLSSFAHAARGQSAPAAHIQLRGPFARVPRFGGIVDATKNQLNYRLGDLILTSKISTRGSTQLQAALALTIRNVGRSTLSVALLRGASLSFDTGVAFDLQIPTASGIALCTSRNPGQCPRRAADMTLLRPGHQLTATLHLVRRLDGPSLDAARVAGFIGSIYVRDLENQTTWVESAMGKSIPVRASAT